MKYKWKNTLEKGMVTLHWPTLKRLAADIPLTAIGGTIGYLGGQALGGAIELLPYVPDVISYATESITSFTAGPDTVNSIGGLAGLVWGVANSGAVLNENNPNELDELKAFPFSYNMRKSLF